VTGVMHCRQCERSCTRNFALFLLNTTVKSCESERLYSAVPQSGIAQIPITKSQFLERFQDCCRSSSDLVILSKGSPFGSGFQPIEEKADSSVRQKAPVLRNDTIVGIVVGIIHRLVPASQINDAEPSVCKTEMAGELRRTEQPPHHSLFFPE